ncbi:MAG: DUF748 domain-containing protein [Pseudomonadales bacterium]
MVWGIFLVLTALLVFGTRPLAKYQLEATLSEQLQRPVTVERLLLRPFQGQVQLHGVKLDDVNYLQQGSVTLQIAPLWRKQLVIDLLEIDGLQLDVVSSAGVTQIAGVDVSTLSAGEEGGPSQPLEWTLALQRLVVRNSKLRVSYEGDEHNVAITQVTVGPVAFAEDIAPAIAARLAVNETVIDFSGTAELLADMQSGSFSGNLLAEALDLSRYGGLLGAEYTDVAGLLDLNQTFSGQFAPEQFSIQLQGAVTAAGLQIPDLAAVERIEYDGNLSASLQGVQTLSADLQLNELTYPALGRVAQIRLEALSYDQSLLKAQSLSVSGVDAQIQRDQSGSLVLPINARANPKPAGEAEPQSVLPEIFINTVDLSDSRFEFVDRSVEPIVDLVLSETQLTLTDFSLNEPFRLDFSARHHDAEAAKLGIKGDYSIAQQSGDLEVNLRDFEIHEIAPYLGNGVKSGRLRLTSNIGMQQGHIKVGNDVYIKNVKVDERAASSSDQMSLSTALFMLKGSDDVVEFEVPFETDFADFKIGLGDIIQTAMVTAARSAAVAYAQYALQPYGSLLFAKNVLGAVTRPRFEPVQFAPAEAELSGDELAYVNKLGEFLSSRSELTVTVCGYAQMTELAPLLERAASDAVTTTSDNAGEVQRLKQLAEARSKHVRDILRAAGVAESQLYGCTAAVESEQRKPRVELAL